MSSKSENKEAAAKLIDFLINDVEANKLLKAERGIPASSEAVSYTHLDVYKRQGKGA